MCSTQALGRCECLGSPRPQPAFLAAVAMLNQLAETVAIINPDVLATCEEIFERGPGDERGFRAVEEQEEMICQIGFQYFPATGVEFCRDLIFKPKLVGD